MKLIMAAFIALMVMASGVEAFTVFYAQKPDGNGRHAILFVLPENTEEISAVSFDEATADGKTALECINAWNMKRRLNRYYIKENVDGSKEIMERSDFSMPQGSLFTLQPLCLNPALEAK